MSDTSADNELTAWNVEFRKQVFCSLTIPIGFNGCDTPVPRRESDELSFVGEGTDVEAIGVVEGPEIDALGVENGDTSMSPRIGTAGYLTGMVGLLLSAASCSDRPYRQAKQSKMPASVGNPTRSISLMALNITKLSGTGIHAACQTRGTASS